MAQTDNKDEKTTEATTESTKTSETDTSSADKATLDSLSSNEMTINAASVNELCTEWNSKVASLDLSGDKIASALKPLTDFGILVNYVAGLSNAIDSLTQSVATLCTTLKNSSDQHTDSESGYDSGGTSSGGTSYSTSGGTHSDTTPTTEADNTDLEPTLDPTDVTIDSLSIQDYLGLSTELYSICKEKGMTLTELLNSDYISEVKEKLLSSSFISDDVKNVIRNLDVDALKILLKSMKGDTIAEFNEDDINYVKEYYKLVADKANIKYTDLLEDNKNKELVYNELYYYSRACEFFDLISGDSNFKNSLTEVYTNDDNGILSDNIRSAIIKLVDVVAAKNNKTSEEFLKTCTSKDFEKVTQTLNVTTDFLNSDTDQLQGLLQKLIGE